jgi:hypothetical protein
LDLPLVVLGATCCVLGAWSRRACRLGAAFIGEMRAKAKRRATLEGNLIRGSDNDFLGQFHRNSNVNLALRYSF